MSTISSDSRFSLILAYRLSALLAVVTLIHAAVGAFWPGIFRDPPMTAGTPRGQQSPCCSLRSPCWPVR